MPDWPVVAFTGGACLAMFMLVGWRKEDGCVGFADPAGNGFGAANFVRSLETLFWLGCFVWRDREVDVVVVVGTGFLFEISRAAICRVTAPTVVMMGPE